jgi:hypothetical protein
MSDENPPVNPDYTKPLPTSSGNIASNVASATGESIKNVVVPGKDNVFNENRIQIVDNEGQETITVATPGKTKISLTEKNGQTNQPLISFESSGDIHFVAANRISFKSKFFSREIG